MGLSVLMRICLFMPSLAGAIGILGLATAHAIESPIVADTVDTDEQAEDHLTLGLDLSENLAPVATINANLVEPMELLEAVEPQQLESTPIATKLDTENSREAEFLSSSVFRR